MREPHAAPLRSVLAERFSCRRFEDREVSRDAITAILDDARHAPSWCNAQPWHVHIVGGPALDTLRTRLTAAARDGGGKPDIPFPESYTGNHAERRRACGRALYESLNIARDAQEARREQMMENFRFFGAPHLAVVTSAAEIGDYGLVDCGSFILAFMLAAHGRGVNTIAQASIARHASVLRDFLAIGSERSVVCGISFGYAALDHPANAFRTDRAKISEIASFVDER